MNEIRYKIITPYRNCYQLGSSGEVIRYSNGIDKTNAKRSELMTWVVLGIAELKPFGRIGKTIPLHEAVEIKDFTFKNGNPKYTIVDLDHGTTRIIGNTTAHGVNKVWKV